MVYGDLQFFDIIVFAVIAIFIIYRLRSVLGKRTGYQKKLTTNQYSEEKKTQIKKLVITDSIDNSKKLKKSSKIQVVSISSMMAEAIKRISNSTSVSSLFK